MRSISRSSWTLLFLLASQILAPQIPKVVGAELKSATLEGFARYVRDTEARIEKELARPDEFLYIDELPEPRRAEVRAALQRGEIFMEPLETLDPSGGEIHAPGGLIHHWIGDVLIRGASLRQVLDLVQDYNHHHDIYKPEVVRSRLLSRDGNVFKIAMQFREKKLITVTVNTEHDVRYTRLDAAHWYSRSVSTRIAQVENAGKPDEQELPVGRDGGFLWRINSYWRFVERAEGVYVECEVVSLTRDIPTGLGWLIRPFITSIPKESLEHTLASTRSAVLARESLSPEPLSPEPGAPDSKLEIPAQGEFPIFPVSNSRLSDSRRNGINNCACERVRRSATPCEHIYGALFRLKDSGRVAKSGVKNESLLGPQTPLLDRRLGTQD